MNSQSIKKLSVNQTTFDFANNVLVVLNKTPPGAGQLILNVIRVVGQVKVLLIVEEAVATFGLTKTKSALGHFKKVARTYMTVDEKKAAFKRMRKPKIRQQGLYTEKLNEWGRSDETWVDEDGWGAAIDQLNISESTDDYENMACGFGWAEEGEKQSGSGGFGLDEEGYKKKVTGLGGYGRGRPVH